MDICLYAPQHQLILLCLQHQLILLSLLESPAQGKWYVSPFLFPKPSIHTHTLFVCLDYTSLVPPGECTKKLNPKESDQGVQPGLAVA